MFDKIANKVSHFAGKGWAFIIALALILVWAGTGPIFNYSDTWQLIINTGTTITTFLMVFLLQNSQNRDGRAMQAKLDEIISALDGARDDLEHIEDMDEKTIEQRRR